MGTITADSSIDDFIRRWAASSGAERANFQSFANELCGLIGVTQPDPAHHDAELNDYTFERAIKRAPAYAYLCCGPCRFLRSFQ